MKRLISLLCLAIICVASWGAKLDKEYSITVNGKARKYILYVPTNVQENSPVVFSLHGAGGSDKDYSPFDKETAELRKTIVIYPSGLSQYFPVFGGSVPGWNSTGEANEEIDFFKAILNEVEKLYTVDRKRIYCCGFSNGGMMTYASANAACDFFAAFGSISGFQLNEFHHSHCGARPVPFIHIHGMADDFVKYSCMPIIRDNMIARNGCNPVPTVKKTSTYTMSTYAAEEGGFPYIYYEIVGMGHSPNTTSTAHSSSSRTFWAFFKDYTLDSECDRTLKWRLNIDATGFNPSKNHWTVNAEKTKFSYGVAKKANNVDNNVYPDLQFVKGDYKLIAKAEGKDGDKVYVKVERLTDGKVIFCKSGEVGKDIVMPFSVEEYVECKITIVKDNADIKFTSLAIHSTEGAVEAQNSKDEQDLPEEKPQVQPTEQGYLIEIPQDQSPNCEDGANRASVETGEGYTQYTTTGGVCVIFKMLEVGVKDCDYILIKFAEPIPADIAASFAPKSSTSNFTLTAGITEYKIELTDSNCDVVNDVLSQITLLTIFKDAGKVVKVAGVYKHCTLAPPADAIKEVTSSSSDNKCYNIAGQAVKNPKGFYIQNGKKYFAK